MPKVFAVHRPHAAQLIGKEKLGVLTCNRKRYNGAFKAYLSKEYKYFCWQH